MGTIVGAKLPAANTVQPLRHSPKLQLIQCFRGLAAFAVLLFHVAVITHERWNIDFFWTFLRAGATGVDFFFVLSGFIILWVHGKDVGHPDRVRRYGWRRFARVYPLYAICTLTLIPLYLGGFGHAEKLTGVTAIKSFLLLPFPPGEHPIVGQGWTLCHEALFYFVFASTIVFGIHWARSIGIIFLTGSLICTIAPLYGAAIGGPYWISHWIFSPYNLEFLAGCASAAIVKSANPKYLRWCLPIGILMLCCVWTSVIPHNQPLAPDDRMVSRVIFLFGLPYTFITIGAVAWEMYGSVDCPKLLLGMGDATYSIYLTHFVLIAGASGLIIRLVGFRGSVAIHLALMGLAGVVGVIGYFIYRWFEKPMLEALRGLEEKITAPALPSQESSRITVQ